MNFNIDFSKILEAASAATPLAIQALLILGAAAIAVAAAYAIGRLIGWGSSVTTLLGNHLRHDVQGVRDEVKALKDESYHQTTLLERMSASIEGLREDFRNRH